MSQTRRVFDAGFKLQVVRMIKDQCVAQLQQKAAGVARLCRLFNVSRSGSRRPMPGQNAKESLHRHGSPESRLCRLGPKLRQQALARRVGESGHLPELLSGSQTHAEESQPLRAG